MPPKTKRYKDHEVSEEITTINMNAPIDPAAPVVQVDAEVVSFNPPPPREKLLAFRANISFVDGNLREAMEKYGYEVEWKMNEVRRLPAWLIRRCIQSGAELDRADG